VTLDDEHSATTLRLGRGSRIRPSARLRVALGSALQAPNDVQLPHCKRRRRPPLMMATLLECLRDWRAEDRRQKQTSAAGLQHLLAIFVVAFWQRSRQPAR
jgi:hypothetical protein